MHLISSQGRKNSALANRKGKQKATPSTINDATRNITLFDNLALRAGKIGNVAKWLRRPRLFVILTAKHFALTKLCHGKHQEN